MHGALIERFLKRENTGKDKVARSSSPSLRTPAMKHAKKILVATLLAAVLASTVAAHDRHGHDRDLSGTNVVLVHGALADGNSWSKVIPLLQARGLHVVAVQNPLSSLADDAAATT